VQRRKAPIYANRLSGEIILGATAGFFQFRSRHLLQRAAQVRADGISNKIVVSPALSSMTNHNDLTRTGFEKISAIQLEVGQGKLKSPGIILRFVSRREINQHINKKQHTDECKQADGPMQILSSVLTQDGFNSTGSPACSLQ